MNTDYINEINEAENFLKDHEDDAKLFALLWKVTKNCHSHSERWSMIYDFMDKYYPTFTGSVVTGLAYLCEVNNE